MYKLHIMRHPSSLFQRVGKRDVKANYKILLHTHFTNEKKKNSCIFTYNRIRKYVIFKTAHRC